MIMKSRETKIVYYENELEDEFSTAVITPRTIDANYDYLGGSLRKAGRVFWYHIIGKPLAFLFLKIKFGHKIINKRCIKQTVKNKDNKVNTGYFLYGNHTNDIADALIPSMISQPVGMYVIVHPNNVSMPVLGKLTPCLGALPLPDEKGAVKNFNHAVAKLIESNNAITIYPEAHIWPYYTGIRNYGDASFRYPVKCQVPVFSFTNTYQKRKWRKTPRIVTYVDGPFYPDKELDSRQQRAKLHRSVMESMKKNCKNSNIDLIKYIKKED